MFSPNSAFLWNGCGLNASLCFRDIPKIRIGILAHGDYCDENVYYVMRWVDLTKDKEKLIKFVDETTGTGGGMVHILCPRNIR